MIEAARSAFARPGPFMPFTADLTLKPRQAIAALAAGALLTVAGWIWGPADQRLAGCLLAFALAWAAAVDIDRFLLPNALTFGLAAAGLALAALRGWQALADSLIGLVVGYGLLAGVGFLYRRLRGRDGLGLGDAKLFAAAGAWLGWSALPTVLLTASFAAMLGVFAMIAARRKLDGATPVAFGPFIAAGFWLAWAFDPFGLVSGPG